MSNETPSLKTGRDAEQSERIRRWIPRVRAACADYTGNFDREDAYSVLQAFEKEALAALLDQHEQMAQALREARKENEVLVEGSALPCREQRLKLRYDLRLDSIGEFTHVVCEKGIHAGSHILWRGDKLEAMGSVEWVQSKLHEALAAGGER